MEDLIRKFEKVNFDAYPDFYNYETPLDMGLWVLWVSKEELNIKKLNSEQIAFIIREIMEISINSKSIVRSFNRAGERIHTYKENDTVYYEIMKAGKDYLSSQEKKEYINLFYFEPDKRFTSKRILSKNILKNIEDDLSIVDPYCGIRTLDILTNIDDRKVRFLTNIENLRNKNKKRFLRELQDFKKEYPNIEFKNYLYTDIHDRYILSSNKLVLLGHSIKDLGRKESFSIILDKDTNKNIFEVLLENFNRRWKQSKPL